MLNILDAFASGILSCGKEKVIFRLPGSTSKPLFDRLPYWFPTGGYERSLLLENVRAQTSQAMLEVPEGLTGNDPAGLGENGSGRLAGDLEELSRAVEKINDFSYPLDLNLERADVRAMLYGVVARFQGEFVERSVSLEMASKPRCGRRASFSPAGSRTVMEYSSKPPELPDENILISV